MNSDRNLLFGILAIRLDFISRDELVAAMNAWVLDKAKTLGQILIDEGALGDERRTLLEALVAEHLKQHGGDPEKSLAAVSSIASVRDDLLRIADPAIQRTLVHVSAGRRDTDPFLTEHDPGAFGSTPSVGTSTSSGARFRILRPHARGGLGEVFVARDEELSREVALKQIQDSHADQPESRARFVLEAEITGGLEHPGIVPVYGLGTYADGRPYYAMRFIRGDSLKDAIDHFHKADEPARDPGERSLALRKLLGRFVDVCNAIEYAHSRGILHRDLKPGNIMLGKYGETLVVDWGLAKAIGRSDKSALAEAEVTLVPSSGSGAAPTQMGSAVGTPAFMSPEQAAGRLDLLSAATDVYSLGATLYCLLTGRPPLEGSDIGDILRKVKQGEITAPRQLKKEVPKALESICLKAMALEPLTRYSSPRSLADDVEHWMADEPVSALQDSPAERLGRFARRHKTWTRAIAGVMLAVIVVSLIAVGLINKQRRIAEGLATEKAQLAQQEADARQGAQEAAKSALAAKKEADNAKNEAVSARDALEIKSKETQHQLALSYIEQGSNAAEQGDAAYAIAKFYQAYRAAPEHDALRESARRLMGAWDAAAPVLLNNGQFLVRAEFSRDGQTVLAASLDGTARLWDAAAGKPRGEPVNSEPSGFTSGRGIAYSPDHRIILAQSLGNTARMWDVTTGKPHGEPLRHAQASTAHHAFSVSAVAFSPDGRIVATGSDDKTACLWDVATGKLHGKPLKHEGDLYNVAFAPDGQVLVTYSSDGIARIWEVATCRPRGEPLRVPQLTALAFSPDGGTLVTAGLGTTARLWDAATGQPRVDPLQHDGPVLAVAFSPDGRVLLTGSSDNTARLWDLATAKIRGEPLKSAVQAVAFSPDGRTAVTGSFDRMARVWDVATGKLLGEPLKHDGVVRTVAISPFAWTVLTGSDDRTTRLWDVFTGKPPGRPLGAEPIKFSPDGRTVLTRSEKTARLWDAGVGEPLGEPLQHDERVYAAAFSPDSRIVLTGSLDGTARLWDAATGKPRGQPLRHKNWVESVAFSPDGRTVITGSADGMARFWDVATGNLRGEPLKHGKTVTGLALSADGRTLVTGTFEDHAVRLWDVETGTLRGEPLKQESYVIDVAFSPDEQTILARIADGTVRLLSAANGTPRGESLRHDVHAMAFSPDGRTFVTASKETARIWDVATVKPLGQPFKDDEYVKAVAFSPDGQKVLTASSMARSWPVPTTPPDNSRFLAAWAGVRSGYGEDKLRGFHRLDSGEWLEAWRQVDTCGEPWFKEQQETRRRRTTPNAGGTAPLSLDSQERLQDKLLVRDEAAPSQGKPSEPEASDADKKPAKAIPQDGADILMATIYKSLKITNARVVGGPFAPGDTVTIAYRLTNSTDADLVVPVDHSFERPFNLVGTMQHWIERQGNESTISAISPRTARNGRKYGAGGSIIPTKPKIAAGESLEFSRRVSTAEYPAGTYRYYIEYKKVRGDVIQTETIDFELINK